MIFLSILILIVVKAQSSITKNLRSEGFTRITTIVLLISGALCFNGLYIKSLGYGVGIYSGLFHITPISQVIEMFLMIIGALILVSWPVSSNANGASPYYIANANDNAGVKLGNESLSDLQSVGSKGVDYSLIVLFSTLGSCLLISSSDLVSIYLSIELQSFGLYILATLYKDSESATSAGLKYFLLGGLSSCIILLGSGLIYSFTGLTNLESIYSLISVGSHSYNFVLFGTSLGLIIVFVGFLFKIAAAPLHNWAPDVYDESPTIVTIWLTIMPKIGILILLLELTTNTNINFFLDSNLTEGLAFSYINNNLNLSDNVWLGGLITLLPLHSLNEILNSSLNLVSGSNTEILSKLFLISSFLSLIVGTVVGLAQNRIKRLLAYSTISHVGFILLALAINTEQSVDALLFYIIQYSITNLNIFLVIIALSYIINNSTNNTNNTNSNNNTNNKDNSNNNSGTVAGLSSTRFGLITDIRYISEFKSQFFSNPLLSLSLSICLFSMAGIPPLIGFFSKQYVLYSAVQGGYYFMSLVAIVVSVISASYYIKVVKVLHEELEVDNFTNTNNTEINTNTNKNTTENLDNNKLSSNLNNKYFNSGLVLSNFHSYLISSLTLAILLFILKPSLILNSTQVLSLTLFNN
uniref:NADH dehydrogenase subunit 2 n=1 Tax=Cyathus jiayuguanensis TaxID=380660 RepID=UPI0023F01CD0|nr:NADH dehydrogenase subunit 2 [Cyathus jiayuguanensis]WDS46479.1 NADH dehydrogenase subunit 2 [Cyathus jiayuguanensis]